MVMAPPEAGDIVWLDFDPQAGREQMKRRPALVLSPKSYNAKVGLCVACPITSKVKGYGFEVVLPSGLKTKGAVLADHVKSLDWKARQAEKIESAPEILEDVLAKLNALLFP